MVDAGPRPFAMLWEVSTKLHSALSGPRELPQAGLALQPLNDIKGD